MLKLYFGIPGVKANFKNLIKIAGPGLPLPFKGVNNRRSFLYLGNLVDAIITCITHPLAAGETFMVSDGQDVYLKIRNLLGWKAPFTMEEGIKETVKYYKCQVEFE